MKIPENKFIRDYLTKLTFKKKESLSLKDDVFFDKKKGYIFSLDTYEENVHFIKNSIPANFVQKIFRASISDIICKGVQPSVYFLSLAITKKKKNWLKSFITILNNEQKKFGLFLGGGDTIRSGKNSISFSVIGHTEQPVLRNGAKNNDDIYVTRNLGDSYIGLQIIKKKINLRKHNNFYKSAYYKPNLPYVFSKYLKKVATSSTDISDGLMRDLKNICISSKCGALVDFASIPFSKKTSLLAIKKKFRLLEVFSHGDDYQIIFTSNKKNRRIIEKISLSTKTRISRIGRIVKGRDVKLNKNGVLINNKLTNTGYIHSL
jgi:thiamine-monophosphate kinase